MTPKTAKLLMQRLDLIYGWYEGMINADTGMLEYLYVPETDTFIHERSPIRDIASVWDAEILSNFLSRRELLSLIEKSLQYYDKYLLRRPGFLILDPARLREPSSIAHSAFMILALLSAATPRRTRPIAALAAGILRQQRRNGSYKVYFEDLPDYGEELYAGESMLALLELYRRSQEEPYLRSAERGINFYDTQYFQRGRVTDDILVFFANWQSQACRLLFECTPNTTLKDSVADYLYRLHDRIIEQGFFEAVGRHPDRQVSVEVACALEGLNDAYTVAQSAQDRRANNYRRCICTGLDYLLTLQCTQEGTDRELGGFGMSLHNRAQRIDVTGHAASAFMKSIANGIECPS